MTKNKGKKKKDRFSVKGGGVGAVRSTRSSTNGEDEVDDVVNNKGDDDGGGGRIEGEGGDGTGSESYEALRRKLGHLVQDNTKKAETIEELMIELSSKRTRKKQQGEDRRKRRKLSGDGAANHHVLMNLLKGTVYPQMKFFAPGWEGYSTDENTMCGLMLSRMTVPSGVEPAAYWGDVREVLFFHLGRLRHQGETKCHEKFKCKFLV